jgi:hypothetical protein
VVLARAGVAGDALHARVRGVVHALPLLAIRVPRGVRVLLLELLRRVAVQVAFGKEPNLMKQFVSLGEDLGQLDGIQLVQPPRRGDLLAELRLPEQHRLFQAEPDALEVQLQLAAALGVAVQSAAFESKP